MLALAPDDVHLDRLPAHHTTHPQAADLIHHTVLDRGVTWPWTSTDPLASNGVIGGDPRHATAELGELLVTAAVDRCGAILDRVTAPTPTPPRRTTP